MFTVLQTKEESANFSNCTNHFFKLLVFSKQYTAELSNDMALLLTSTKITQSKSDLDFHFLVSLIFTQSHLCQCTVVTSKVDVTPV